jgi:hypothetical protein
MRLSGTVGRKVGRIAGVAAAAGSSLPATPSWALCPNCLGQSPTLSPALRLVGLFLLVPPAIFFAVAIAIQKLSRPKP